MQQSKRSALSPNSEMSAFYVILIAAWTISSGVYGTRFAWCDCDYHAGGCAISTAAPAGWACHCYYKGAWTCGGTLAYCQDNESHYCSNPDTSVQSCVIGGGDCQGYADATCDCDYHSGGCTISRVPPHDTACHCTYKGAWTCGGSLTGCRNFRDNRCKNPDSSIHTCIQGYGDCGGY